MIWKKRLALLLACAALVLCAACGAAPEPAQRDDTLIYGSGSITRINPAMDEHGEINLLLFAVLTPQNEAWDRLIGQQLPEARHVTRYAMRKDTGFDRKKLRALASQLPAGYLLRRIDGALYTQCLADPATADFVSAFDSRAHYLEYGCGVVILKGGRIVSGASSYRRYRQGIEIEVDTIEPERRRHLAQTACAGLILLCLDEGLYPSWDAQNPGSVRLAETLGYEVSHAYPAYELFTPPQP